MTHSEVEKAVALATGETRREIRRRGFSIVQSEITLDAEYGIRAPQMIDWDELDAMRVGLFP